jgi:hypothetical protein
MRRAGRLIAWLLLVSALIGAYGALTAALILALTGEVALAVLIVREARAGALWRAPERSPSA